MILSLARSNHPVWKQKFKNIKSVTPEIKKLAENMGDTLDLTGGVGLAAPQVGQPTRIFIINFGKVNEVFINPKIISRGKETDLQEEGCLSLPRVWGEVSRPTQTKIEFLDLKGRKKVANYSGYYARIVQHEYDHLTSVFFADRVTDKNKIYTYDPIKMVFFGTPEVSSLILYNLAGKQFVGEYEIPLVVTAPDRPVGRSKSLLPTPVKSLANKFGLETTTPEKVKNNHHLVNQIKNANPDFLIVVSYGQILPKQILEIPKKAALNIHFSLLPKYRGASPVQAAILNGDKTTGVSIIKMNEKMDQGDIVAQAKIRINPTDTTLSLTQRLTLVGADLLNFAIHTYVIGKVKARKQNRQKATYTKLISKEDGFIDLKKPPKPESLERMIRSYHPWPGVWGKLRINNEELRIKLLPNKMVQLEGKKPVSFKNFKQGHKNFKLTW